jgi:hypothetical protein
LPLKKWLFDQKLRKIILTGWSRPLFSFFSSGALEINKNFALQHAGPAAGTVIAGEFGS